MKTERRKEEFEAPTAKLIVFDSADVITSSSGIDLPDDEF